MENNVIILNFNDSDYSDIISDAMDNYCAVANGLIDYHNVYNETEKIELIKDTYFNPSKISNFIAANIIGNELIGAALGFDIQDISFYEKYKKIASELTNNICIKNIDEFIEMKKNMNSCKWLVIKIIKGKLKHFIY